MFNDKIKYILNINVKIFVILILILPIKLFSQQDGKDKILHQLEDALGTSNNQANNQPNNTNAYPANRHYPNNDYYNDYYRGRVVITPPTQYRKRSKVEVITPNNRQYRRGVYYYESPYDHEITEEDLYWQDFYGYYAD